MKSRNQYSKYYGYLCLIIITSTFLFFKACSETISPDETSVKETENIVSDEIAEALAKIPNPISKNLVVKRAERHFVDLSEKIPQFAGYYLDRQTERHVRDDKLIVLLTGKGNASAALEKVRSHISDRFDKAIPGSRTSDIIVKEAKYNFRQLQAFRDILHKPAFETEGVTMIDLAEDKNRIVVGVLGESYIQNVEETLQTLPVPREAVIIEVFGMVQPAVSNEKNIKESVPANLLTHQTVRNTVRPLTGGLKIYNPKKGNCTLGMVAKWGGNAVFITNAHCTKPFGLAQNDAFYQISEYIGSEVHDVQFTPDPANNRAIRYSDAAIVQLQTSNFSFGTVAFTNSRGHDWGDNYASQRQIVHGPVGPKHRLEYVDEQESLINLPVVKTGQTTGTTVGYVNRTCVTMVAPQEINPDPYYQLLCQDVAGPLYSDFGDSGSPVYTDYTPDIEEGEANLIGLLHGVVVDENQNLTQESAYTPLDGIRVDLETANLGLSFVPVSISIFGNDNIQNTGNYSYGTNVDNATGSVSYQWSIKWEGSSSWNTLGTSSNQSVSVTNGDDYTLKVEATDDISTSTALFPVTVVTEECSPFDPCSN